jgi:ribosomal protein S18 acetylase RimI-like enzyme
VNTVARMQLRRMSPVNLPQVLQIEEASFATHWNQHDFERVMANTARLYSCRVITGAIPGKVLAYAVWERHEDHWQLLNLAVDPDHRRMGLGRKMIETTAKHGLPLTANVVETNLPAQIWLREIGWRCTMILSGIYADSDRSAYRFEKHHDCEA